MKQMILSIGIFGLLAAPLALVAPAGVGAQNLQDCDGIGECLSGGAVATDPDADPNAEERVSDLIQLVINIFSLVVGVVSVIMIIIGGLKYIISGGDAGNVTGAKNTILYAIVGLVVVALAQIIVRFVLGQVAGNV
ncbi:MAG: pilin [Candidatus Saccharibacteria bacterium]|nr:pilin [Candidatus Saccharibacteria bacterium]